MKTRIILIALLALISHPDYSQDMMTYKNGMTVLVKVTEITSAEIYFNTADNPEGSVSSVLRRKIHTIQYANGSRIVFGAGPGSKQNEKYNKKDQPVINQSVKFSEPFVAITDLSDTAAHQSNVNEPGRKH